MYQLPTSALMQQTRSSTHLLALRVNCFYGRKNKEKVDDYWQRNLKTEVRSKNTPAITAYDIGAAKDNKMKIFKIISEPNQP